MLSPAEIRVLGALMEKSITTPDYYPMTLNSLTAACNQKTSRHPVTNYGEEEIQDALGSLKGQSLVATAVGGGSRAIKYKHNFGTVYNVSDAGFAIMCLLFLRGSQTPGEINTNSARLYQFASIESVHEALSELARQDPPLVKQMPRNPGQKEARYTHTFGHVAAEPGEIQESGSYRDDRGLEHRVTELERQVAMLNAIVTRLGGDSSQ